MISEEPVKAASDKWSYSAAPVLALSRHPVFLHHPAFTKIRT